MLRTSVRGTRGRRLVADGILQRLAATTEEGQAFRVDTSLRPEGRDGPLVRSIAGFRAYYERWAKPWEFQALIKARPVAGDPTLGQQFTDLVRPYVYPERLSPEAIREIRGMKARAERALAARGVAQREVKRGPGGIRDIEFAVQLLQLVHARRDTSLRSGNTLEALSALAHGAYVGDDDAADLAEAYQFLRKIEHRLQLAQERQTHTVPEDEGRRRTLARSLGFRDSPTQTALEAFEEEWRRTQTLVRRIHEKLFYRPLLERFAQAPALNPDAAQERLSALGFKSPGRSLKFLGDLTSGLSRRAQLMRNLLPVMLDWMADAPDPDLAVSAFRDVALRVGSNPAALAALRDAPPVVELLCRVLGTSKMLGEYLLHVPDFVAALADERTLARKTREQLHAEAIENVEWRSEPETRDAAIRRLKRREVLRIACRDLAGGVSVEDVGRELAFLAEGALRAATSSLEEEHPAPPGARFSVVGMGKLGGEELNYASDVDVMFVFDAPDDRTGYAWASAMGEGLLQRLAATTEEGQAFRVDARLRPEGKDGPLVRSIAGFRAYYERRAQPWEFQALIKARPVAGDPTLGQQFTDLVRPYVYPERLSPEAIREIRGMKARIEKERLGPREDPKFQMKVGARRARRRRVHHPAAPADARTPRPATPCADDRPGDRRRRRHGAAGSGKGAVARRRVPLPQPHAQRPLPDPRPAARRPAADARGSGSAREGARLRGARRSRPVHRGLPPRHPPRAPGLRGRLLRRLMTERTVVAAGVPMFVREEGAGDPVVLLHGFPQTGACWGAVAERLAKRYRVIVPDLPGFGRSGAPPRYEAEAVAGVARDVPR